MQDCKNTQCSVDNASQVFHFVDINGAIYPVYELPDGKLTSPAPYTYMKRVGLNLMVGAFYSEGDGFEVDHEFDLHESLTELAARIEGSKAHDLLMIRLKKASGRVGALSH